MGITAYKKTITETETPRQIERRVFSWVTSRLEKYQLSYDKTDDNIEKLQILSGGLRHALWQNEQVWMTVKTDLLSEDNVLEPGLKAPLISLALWVEKQTALVLHGEGDVLSLIEINRNIILGLGGSGTKND